VVVLIASVVNHSSGTAVIGILGLILSVLIVCVLNSGALSQERSQQTLAILLTTKLTAREIIAQKMRALARVRWALTACTCAGLLLARHQSDLFERTWGHQPWSDWSREELEIDALQCWLLIAVPAIAGWIAMRIGMRMINHRRALLTALGVVGAWLIGALLLHGWIDSIPVDRKADGLWDQLQPLLDSALLLASPLEALGESTVGAFGPGWLVLLVAAAQLSTWLLLRWNTLATADRLLAAAEHGR
jgi:hypothetical protein